MKLNHNTEEYIVHLTIQPGDNGYYIGTSDNLPGLFVECKTYQEVLEVAQDAARLLIECYREDGRPLPDNLRKVGQEKNLSIAVPV